MSQHSIAAAELRGVDAEVQRDAQCVGKDKFESRTAALVVIDGHARRHSATPPVVYRCMFCRKWHIGTSKRRTGSRKTIRRNG